MKKQKNGDGSILGVVVPSLNIQIARSCHVFKDIEAYHR